MSVNVSSFIMKGGFLKATRLLTRRGWPRSLADTILYISRNKTMLRNCHYFFEPINGYPRSFPQSCCIVIVAVLRERCWRWSTLIWTSSVANGACGSACTVADTFISSNEALSDTIHIWGGFKQTATDLANARLIWCRKFRDHIMASSLTPMVTAASILTKNAMHRQRYG